MYCGSCMRDNRLASTLIAQGYDIHPMAMYTPILSDEPDACRPGVRYGGMGLYLSHRSRLFRALPPFVQQLADHPAVLRLATRIAIKTDAAGLGALTVAMLQPESPIHRRYLAALVHELAGLQPDLVHVPNLMFVALAEHLARTLHVPMICTLAGEDVFLDELPDPYRTQAHDLIRRASLRVAGFIAPTRYYATAMIERFGLDPGRVHHVPLGIHCNDGCPPAQSAEDPYTIGFLARVCPQKGLLELADAFIRLRREGRHCRLRAAGTLAAGHRAYLRQVQQRLAAANLHHEFEYVGEVDRAAKLAFLSGLQCLSVPAPYPEAKGLYVLEALMMGVPVVLPEHGSFPELVEATAGGLLYDRSDPANLAAALATLMDDPQRRIQLGEQGRRAVCASFTAEAMAQAAWSVFEQYARMHKGTAP